MPFAHPSEITLRARQLQGSLYLCFVPGDRTAADLLAAHQGQPFAAQRLTTGAWLVLSPVVAGASAYHLLKAATAADLFAGLSVALGTGTMVTSQADLRAVTPNPNQDSGPG